MGKVKGKASRGPDGNVTIDLGEALERRLREGGMAGAHGRGLGARPHGMGAHGWGFSAPSLGAKLGIPTHVNTGRMVGGGLLGAVGNRLLRRVTPSILGTDSELAVDGVNALVGVVPFFFAKNDMTVGIALPGVLQLAFDLADAGLDALGMTKPALQGDRRYLPRQAPSPAAAVRERLQNLRGALAPRAAQPAAWQPRPVRVLQPAM